MWSSGNQLPDHPRDHDQAVKLGVVSLTRRKCIEVLMITMWLPIAGFTVIENNSNRNGNPVGLDCVLSTLWTINFCRLSKYFIVVILAVGLSAGVVVGLTGDETHHQFLNQSQLCVFTTVTDPNAISIFACYVVMAAWQGEKNEFQSNLNPSAIISKSNAVNSFLFQEKFGNDETRFLNILFCYQNFASEIDAILDKL